MISSTPKSLARMIFKMPDTGDIDAFALVTATHPHSDKPSALTFEFGVPHSQFPTPLPDSYFEGVNEMVPLLLIEEFPTSTDYREVLNAGKITSNVDNFAQFTLLAQLYDPIYAFISSILEMFATENYDEEFSGLTELAETGDPQYSLFSAFDTFVSVNQATRDFTTALQRHQERYDWSSLDPQIVRIHDQIERQCGIPHERIYVRAV